MKQNIGELTEAELKARRRFWNKKGFFGEPTKKALERDSMKMQKLVKALKTFSLEEVKEIRAKRSAPRYLVGCFTRVPPRIYTRCGTLANQILIMQYQPLKYFSYGFSKKKN